jgi:hypothetical protein
MWRLSKRGERIPNHSIYHHSIIMASSMRDTILVFSEWSLSDLARNYPQCPSKPRTNRHHNQHPRTNHPMVVGPVGISRRDVGGRDDEAWRAECCSAQRSEKQPHDTQQSYGGRAAFVLVGPSTTTSDASIAVYRMPEHVGSLYLCVLAPCQSSTSTVTMRNRGQASRNNTEWR